MLDPIIAVMNTWRIGVYNRNFKQSKDFFQNNIKNINDNNFWKHKSYIDFVKREIAIHRHLFSYKIIKNENGYVTFNAVNFTSSSKDIIINGESVKVSQIGTFLKEGKQVPQYTPNIYCNITMSIKEFNDIVNDITDNKDFLEQKGLTIEQVKILSDKISEGWENRKVFNYQEYLQKNIEPFYNIYLKENTLKENLEQHLEIKNDKLEEE